MTRIGKIARLPRETRNELNRRINDGESGRRLLEWLNALPEVRSILDRDFDARDINDQNLSDWKQGGYRDWLAQQEALSHVGELAANADELAAVVRGRISDHLATILAARYATEFSGWHDGDGEDLRRTLRVLRDICRDVVELRRGDHEAARLQIEQARLDQERDKTDEEVIQYFRRWLEYPKVQDSIRAPDDPEKLMREVFGLEQPQTAVPPAPQPEIQGNSS
jgi:hypothetical protein